MRILMANKFWYVRGGLERVMFHEVELLESAGHEVAHFSCAHPMNEPSEWSEFFAPYIELGAEGGLAAADRLTAALRMFDNPRAAAAFDRLCETFRPDVLHCHGIHRQLSPSILRVARRRGIPVVQTLHDYHHICPCDVLLRGGTRVCEPRACAPHWYGPAIASRCVRGSLAASTLSAAETWVQRFLRRYERGVSRFISPSVFLSEQMGAGGWSVPIDLVRNPVEVRPDGPVRERGTYIAYAGRLSGEKGVDVLISAAAAAGVELRVAGDGPERDRLQALSSGSSVQFLGHLPPLEVERLLESARAAVVPSIWYENAPLSVLEPMSRGIPVIAAAIGGIPEQLDDGVEGLLVAPGDVEALAAAMTRVAEDDAFVSRAGEAAYDRVRTVNSPARHLTELVAVYESVLNKERLR